MTNYNYKKAILTTFLILPLFTSAIAIGAIPNTYAGSIVIGDSNPPDYRGDDDSVFAAWQSFSICLDPNGNLEPDGRPPPGTEFPVEPILFNAIETSGDLFDEDPTIEFEDQLPAQKVYHLTMPNIVDDLDTKNVRIQITTCNFLGLEDLTPVQFGDFDAQDDGESVEVFFDDEPIISPSNGFTHFTQDFVIHPNPDIEFFEFFIPGDALLVSVIVDTVSFSEGGEGCSPGHWKNHLDDWTGYDPDGSYETVFGVDASLKNKKDTLETPTLLEALKATGGKENALAREAVAALLNIANPDVNYDLTTAEVIGLVQDAYSTGDFNSARDVLRPLNHQSAELLCPETIG